ncbi:hypothetical protein MP31_06825 [Escherichia coli N36254PS]|nr:hypothetical protein MP31_06825 [Escherichia coli N36254PS]
MLVTFFLVVWKHQNTTRRAWLNIPALIFI